MIRRLVAGLIVVGLAVGIWALWPREDSTTTTTTPPGAVEPTSTSSVAMSTTTIEVTTSSGSDTHVVTTVEEAQEILRQLWFGWFEGIYNQDEERIKEVVGTQAMLDSARGAFGTLRFASPPSEDEIRFADIEILRADASCLALWISGEVGFVDVETPSVTSVEGARWTGTSWVLVSTWRYRDDIWEADCEGDLESLS